MEASSGSRVLADRSTEDEATMPKGTRIQLQSSDLTDRPRIGVRSADGRHDTAKASREGRTRCRVAARKAAFCIGRLGCAVYRR